MGGRGNSSGENPENRLSARPGELLRRDEGGRFFYLKEDAMRHWGVVTFLTVALVTGLALIFNCCGGGSSGGDHPLRGTWEGHITCFGPLPVTLSIDGSGELTKILVNGAPSTTILGGEVDDGPDIYTMTWIHETLGPIAFPFLTDAAQVHAAIVPMWGPVAYVGALEKDGDPTTVFFQSDVVDSWSGYGYAYSQTALDFMPFSPVTVDASSGTPIAFTVTMPVGVITGTLPDFANLMAFWGGTAAVTGADVWAVMSPDKQFVAVEAVPVGYSNLEDLTFFALSRD